MSNNWQRWTGIMKCVPFEEKRLAKWQPPYIVQPKYDGVRCKAVPINDNEYLLLSSEENVVFSVPHINKALKKMSLNGMELDGELYCHNATFEDIVSVTSRTRNLHPNYEMISYHIFDVVSNEPQLQRLSDLISINTVPPILTAPFWICDDLDSIMNIYYSLIDNNFEGIIVRHKDNVYEKKRSTMLMKFKPKKEDIYEICGWEEEISINGEPKGRLGSVKFKSQEGDIGSVGSGFTDESRNKLWSARDELEGKFIRIQYQHITPGRKVPRFPVFVEIVDE